MSHRELSIILPIQENSKGFPVSLVDIDAYASKKEDKYEIIVSASGKNENISALRRNFSSIISHLRFVSGESDDAADLIKQGAASAHGDYLFIVDSERRFISEEADLMEVMLRGRSADAVFGVYREAGAMSAVQNRISRFFTGLSSAQAAIIGLKRDVAEKTIPQLDSAGIFNFKLALSAVRSNYEIKEIMSKGGPLLNTASESPAESILEAVRARFRFEAGALRKSASILQKS